MLQQNSSATMSAFRGSPRSFEHKDNKNFDEIVALIARLAVPITPY
jgi:hypothetical protein